MRRKERPGGVLIDEARAGSVWVASSGRLFAKIAHLGDAREACHTACRDPPDLSGPDGNQRFPSEPVRT